MKELKIPKGINILHAVITDGVLETIELVPSKNCANLEWLTYIGNDEYRFKNVITEAELRRRGKNIREILAIDREPVLAEIRDLRKEAA